MTATPAKLPETVNPGELTWVQISPYGEFPQTDANGRRIVQRVDEEAARRLAAAFEAGGREVLVDADHGSENGGSSEAYAWIQKLKAGDDGLWAAFKWTDKGAEAVSARRFRFVSPAWTVDGEGRPEALASVALVNNPNILSRPILNSAGGGSAEPKPKNDKVTMDKLKEMLGLAPDADDAAVLAAVEALQASVAEMEEKALNAEADAFAEEHKDKCEDPEVLKNAYKRDRELAKSLVLAFRKPAPPAPAPAARKTVCNSAAARAPDIARDRPLSERLRGMSPEQACAALLKD